ncbi:MAG: hypothetical protein ACI8S6_001806 [Myxococcota bacterium]|jgi:hypothetical protein
MSWPWLLQWRWRGAPVRVHVAAPAAVIVAGMLLGSGSAMLACALVIAVHLAGHVLMCWRADAQLARVDVHAFGGDAAPQGQVLPGQLVAIAFGGVGAQVLLAISLALAASAGLLGEGSDTGFIHDLGQLNLVIGALNLLPLAGSDGRLLWTLLQKYAIDEEKLRWQSILDAEQVRDAVPQPVSPRREADARQELLVASLRVATTAELVERDARADEGIPPALAQEVAALLLSAWEE